MQIKVGGVPEHFNLPWHLAIENGVFDTIGIQVEWQDMHGGTGEMCQKLRDGSLDIAILLTEGIVKDIVLGNPSLIVQKFVKSPLVWGVHTGASRSDVHLSNWSKLKFAISRYGSGSHLMAHVEAANRGVKLSDEQFVEVGNFNAAVNAIENKKADVILWEKFTTLPFLKSGKLTRLAETVTPWPCFVVAASTEILAKHPDMVWNMLWKLRKECRHFMHDATSIKQVAERYNLSIDEARNWFNQTEWEQDVYLSKKMLQNVLNTLSDVGVLNKQMEPEELCWNRTVVY
jgi:sulfonate transport system substrate-binding protein